MENPGVHKMNTNENAKMDIWEIDYIINGYKK